MLEDGKITPDGFGADRELFGELGDCHVSAIVDEAEQPPVADGLTASH